MFQGKTAIVTGSTSGIGLGIARSFAAEGAHILLNGFGDADRIQELKAGLAQEFGVKVEYSSADMSKPPEIREMVAQAVGTLGGADILVNNAGIQFTASIEEFPEEKWDAILAINLSAAFHATKAALPQMKKAGWGRIINIASVHGLVASAHKAAYVAAKHGIVGLTKVTALENAASDITCNAICPGWVHTPLVQKQIEDKAAGEGIAVAEAEKRLLGEKQPSQRFVKPEQIGALAVFLCGPNGSGFTGASLNVDGGWLAQ